MLRIAKEESTTNKTNLYWDEISDAIDAYTAHIGINLGACIIEPVLQGAGGMRLIDPRYQQAMAAVCKQRNIPLILDEVFTGFWRLGVPSAATLLHITPDIACYAKLLTGGVVPLALTLTTASVFDAFQGDEKAYALLHGHSYTAHPLGCAAAVKALELFTDPSENQNLSPTSTTLALQPLWDQETIRSISHNPGVTRVVALGTVVAVEIDASGGGGGGGAGYRSDAAVGVVKALGACGVYARPLGNVVYIMVTPMTSKEECHRLLQLVQQTLSTVLQGCRVTRGVHEGYS